MLAVALLLAAAAPAPVSPPAVANPAPAPRAEAVIEPVWLSGPGPSLMANCTKGYLTDPAFTGESIVVGCVVQKDGSLGQCLVKESKRAQAAGVQDVAICAVAGFRMGPIDKFGKPVAGRPVLIPMGIATVVDPPAAPAPTPPK